MRISTDPTDPGFLPALIGPPPRPRIDVFVDEVRQDAVVTADDVLGLAVIYVRDGDGGFKHEAGKLLRAELHGAVRIVQG